MSEPSRREKLRPAELIGMSAIIGVVIGVITYFATRDLLVAVEVLGGAFIVSLVVGVPGLILAWRMRRAVDETALARQA